MYFLLLKTHNRLLILCGFSALRFNHKGRESDEVKDSV